MKFGNMSRSERIDMMHKRFEWLSKLVRYCSTLEEFEYKYGEYLGIRGIELKRTKDYCYVSFCGYECETYSIVQNTSDIQVSPIILWQNELCANEEINIKDYDYETFKDNKA